MSVLVSTLVLVLIGTGLAFRRRPAIHWPIMVSAFALALGLVIYLEASRQAIERAAVSVHPLVWVHAGISTVVLVLWCVMLRLGWVMLRRPATVRHIHRRVAKLFLALRLANFATSLAIPTHRPAAAVVTAEAADHR
jgi:hypothetical protein